MVFIVKVPGINGLKSKGCEGAGNAILKVLKEEIFSNESGKDIEFEKLDLEEIHLDNKNVSYSNELIYKNAFESFEEHTKTIFLGGDQSITYSISRAFFDFVQNKNSGKKPCLIVFDAHSDLKAPKNKKIPSHREWLRQLIEDGFPAENILLVGIRNYEKEEYEFIKKKGIKIIPINSLNQDLEGITDAVMEFSSGKELYVSFDIDVIDPAFAPSTGYIEPGGLTSGQAIYLLQRINKIKNLHGIDIVEINSEKDAKNNNLTVKLGAKLLSELL